MSHWISSIIKHCCLLHSKGRLPAPVSPSKILPLPQTIFFYPSYEEIQNIHNVHNVDWLFEIVSHYFIRWINIENPNVIMPSCHHSYEIHVYHPCIKISIVSLTFVHILKEISNPNPFTVKPVCVLSFYDMVSGVVHHTPVHFLCYWCVIGHQKENLSVTVTMYGALVLKSVFHWTCPMTHGVKSRLESLLSVDQWYHILSSSATSCG